MKAPKRLTAPIATPVAAPEAKSLADEVDSGGLASGEVYAKVRAATRDFKAALFETAATSRVGVVYFAFAAFLAANLL